MEYANTIKKTISNVEQFGNHGDNIGVSSSILGNISNSMSDRCITNEAVDKRTIKDRFSCPTL